MGGDFEKIEGASRPTQTDESIEALTVEIQELRKTVLEERFIFIVIFLIMSDSLIFRGFSNWGDPLVIGALELIALVILARRCRVEDLTGLIDRFIGWARGSRDERPLPPHNPVP